MKSTLSMELSKKSLEKAIKHLNDFKNAYEQGIENSVKIATELMYEKVKQYCYENGIVNHTGNIHMEYDPDTKIGRVWTSDLVLIFNEMGTGITGSNSPHPNPSKNFKDWKYDVNEHGEKGWVYPKSDGTFGWTKGLPSKHMFYNAFNDIKRELPNYINVEINKTVGDLY